MDAKTVSEIHEYVQRQRTIHYEVGCEYQDQGDDAERYWGYVDACDDILARLYIDLEPENVSVVEADVNKQWDIDERELGGRVANGLLTEATDPIFYIHLRGSIALGREVGNWL